MLNNNISKNFNEQILGQSYEQLKEIFEKQFGVGILDDKSFFEQEFKPSISNINDLIKNQAPIDSEISKVIDKYFFELLA